MTQRLFLALGALFLMVGLTGAALAEGRSDWTGYAWQQIKLAQCTGTKSVLSCPVYHQKWDWKRDQWVDIAVTVDLAGGEFHVTQRLTNNASIDDDNVCVTALAVNAASGNLAAHHQNWHMNPGELKEESFSYPASALSQLAAIYIGSKQCREGSHQDDALYARVEAAIGD